ncbi:MAG: DUF1836 domain-containing protein [Acholeplasmatales bacterium]|nr:DUF1836 domain-containing protein [Acholeplasmatales bacterium]
MDKIKPILTSWLDELDSFEFPDYEKFPDIELYMDQVINYLQRELRVLQTSSLDHVITSSMVNNYVKGKVVSAPISKKYNKEHLALINETCSLKQVLSIAEIKQILDSEYKDTPKSEAFNSFKVLCKDEFKKAIDFTNEKLANISDDNDIEALTKLALELSITANAYITIAKRILYYNKKYTDMKEIKAELAEKNND